MDTERVPDAPTPPVPANEQIVLDATGSPEMRTPKLYRLAWKTTTMTPTQVICHKVGGTLVRVDVHGITADLGDTTEQRFLRGEELPPWLIKLIKSPLSTG